jgi:hypothetical protein
MRRGQVCRPSVSSHPPPGPVCLESAAAAAAVRRAAGWAPRMGGGNAQGHGP